MLTDRRVKLPEKSHSEQHLRDQSGRKRAEKQPDNQADLPIPGNSVLR